MSSNASNGIGDVGAPSMAEVAVASELNHDEAADFHRRLTAAREGSNEALGELLTQCRGYLLAVARRHLPALAAGKEAESDLVQDSLLAAHTQFDQFAGDNESALLAWLCRIVDHQAIAIYRRYVAAARRDVRREVRFQDSSGALAAGHLPALDTPSPSGRLMRQEEHQQLLKSLEQLPEDYRRVITWRNWERRTFREIGQLLGKSENAARKLWVRALESLEEMMLEFESNQSDCHAPVSPLANPNGSQHSQ